MYLYLINMPSYQDSIAALECSIMTGGKVTKNFCMGERYMDIENAAYIGTCIEIYKKSDSLQYLYKEIDTLKYEGNGYAVKFINTDTHVDFKTRKKIETDISNIFPGAPDLKDPVDEFIVTLVHDTWMFGIIRKKTQNRWLLYSKKPYTFCSSLPSRMARALVNIGTMGKNSIRLIDPCCGMGTVVIEAMDMGIDAWGTDTNLNVVRGGNANLKYFGFKERIAYGDAAHIDGHYDVSVVDLPYGVLCKTDKGSYNGIIENMRKISSRMVILSGEDISDIIQKEGFTVTDGCIVHKGGLDRHIMVCQ